MCGVRWVACSLLWPDLQRLVLEADEGLLITYNYQYHHYHYYCCCC